MRLPASDSRLGRLPWSRLGFWMFMEMGFAPTKESCRLRPMAESKGPVVMLRGSAEDGFEDAGGPEDSRKSSNSKSWRSMSPSLSATLTTGAESTRRLAVSCERDREAGDREAWSRPKEPPEIQGGLEVGVYWCGYWYARPGKGDFGVAG